MTNRLDYILRSPELAERVTDGGVFRKGLWARRRTSIRRHWTICPETTASRTGLPIMPRWVDLDL